ncbi:MAG: helix-turn-helix protein [Proteobacteria bacterium]|nr:helix-turn-helix protein [Pseudomonadota bacterium]
MSEQMDVGEIPAAEVLVEQLPKVGGQLRAAREAAGLLLPEVAAALKLGERQLEALENDNWKVLPGATFVRGFVRNYARLVHLDPLPLMKQLDVTLEKPVMRLGEAEMRQARMPQGGPGISRRDRLVVVTGGALVGLAALIYFLLPNDLSAWRNATQGLLDSFSRQPPPAVVEPAVEPVFPPGTTPQQVMNPQAEVPAVAAPAPAAVEPSGAPAPANPVAEKNLQVSGAPIMRFVFDKESWVEVRDRDSKVIYSQRTAGGSEQSLASGQGPFSLVIGYAPGVKLFWHGQAIDLAPYTHGDVARLVLE